MEPVGEGCPFDLGMKKIQIAIKNFKYKVFKSTD